MSLSNSANCIFPSFPEFFSADGVEFFLRVINNLSIYRRRSYASYVNFFFTAGFFAGGGLSSLAPAGGCLAL